MTLLFTPSHLIRYYQNGAYNATAPVDLSDTPFASVPSTLIAWLGSQLSADEIVSQVVLEHESQVGVTFESQDQTITSINGTTSVVSVQVPTSFRSVLSAAVSVTSPLGQRTFSLSSENLPSNIQDGLLSAWEYLLAL